MDPKMDSGYLAPGETMEDDYDVSQTLLPEEIIGIIDQLLCHEVSLEDIRRNLRDEKTFANMSDGLAHGISSSPDNLHKLVY